MGLFVPMEKLDVGTARQQIDRFETPTGLLFVESVKEGFRLNPVPSAVRFANFAGHGTTDFKTTNRRAFLRGDEGPVPLSKETWEENPDLFRDDVEFFPSMTEGQAKILAKRSDSDKRRDFIFSHTKPGLGTLLTGLTGGLIGSIPDPTNFIPILNFAKAAAVARMGRVLGRAIVNSVEAGLVTAATQPIVFAAEHAEQGDYDLAMAATSVSFAFGIGGGFGAISGRLSRMPLEDRLAVVSKAADDVSKGQPIDLRMFEAELTKGNMNDFIRAHVRGEDISGVKVAERGDLIFSEAVDFLQNHEPRNINGKDLLSAITSGSFGNELQRLMASKVDDIGLLRKVLSLFNKKATGSKLSVSEEKFLAAFIKGDNEFFEEIISQSIRNSKEFKAIVESGKSELKAKRKLLDAQRSEIENVFVKEDLKSTGKFGRIKSVIDSEIERINQEELRGLKTKSIIDDFKSKALRSKLRDIVDKEIQYKKDLDTHIAVKDRQVFNNNRRLDAENRIKQVKGEQPPLRFDTAAKSTEEFEPTVAKKDSEIDLFDEISDEAISGNQKAVDDLIEAEPKLQNLLKSELDDLETISEREKKYASVGDVYKAVLDCLIKGE